MRIKKFDSMNVIPFIDIMLVLLAIVLTFSTLIVQGRLELKLPEANTTEQKNIKQKELSIDSKGKLYFEKQKITMDELKNLLNKMSKSTPISLKADENTPFKTFVKVIDIFKELKLEKISIITELKK